MRFVTPYVWRTIERNEGCTWDQQSWVSKCRVVPLNTTERVQKTSGGALLLVRPILTAKKSLYWSVYWRVTYGPIQRLYRPVHEKNASDFGRVFFVYCPCIFSDATNISDHTKPPPTTTTNTPTNAETTHYQTLPHFKGKSPHSHRIFNIWFFILKLCCYKNTHQATSNFRKIILKRFLLSTHYISRQCIRLSGFTSWNSVNRMFLVDGVHGWKTHVILTAKKNSLYFTHGWTDAIQEPNTTCFGRENGS